jgi:hypothetical protein
MHALRHSTRGYASLRKPLCCNTIRIKSETENDRCNSHWGTGPLLTQPFRESSSRAQWSLHFNLKPEVPWRLDPVEYMTCTRHSNEFNEEVYERIQRDDMMQAAVILAAYVYDAAMRENMLPRKPLPKPAPAAAPASPKP